MKMRDFYVMLAGLSLVGCELITAVDRDLIPCEGDECPPATGGSGGTGLTGGTNPGGGGTGGTAAGGTNPGGGGTGGGACVPEDEICGNGVDDDCDGKTDADDEDCDCTPGATQECGTDVGECSKGTQDCTSEGTWGACEGNVGPTDETCNGDDDDCDGTPDNNLIDEGGECGSDVGECSKGTEVCVSGALECQGNQGPTQEICDGLDNDCQNGADDGTTCVATIEFAAETNPPEDELFKAYLMDNFFTNLPYPQSSVDSISCTTNNAVTGIVELSYEYLVWDTDSVGFKAKNVKSLTIEAKESNFAGAGSNQCPDMGGVLSEYSSQGFTTLNITPTSCGYACDDYVVGFSGVPSTTGTGTYEVVITVTAVYP